MYGAGNTNQQGSSNPNQNYNRSYDGNGKQVSGYDDSAIYPSLATQQQQQQSSAPSFANNSGLPLYYSNAPSGASAPEDQFRGYPTHPPQPQPPVYQPVAPYVPPPYSGDYRGQGCIGTTLKLIIFHFFNAILGISSFVLVVAGSSISIGLIPLCCFGIVLFRALLYIVGCLAKLDVMLYNYISPPSEHVYVDIPQEARFFGIAGERLSPKLFAFSPLSITAALYFGTIKFAVGILSNIVMALNVGLLVTLVATLSPDDYMDGLEMKVNDRSIDVSEHPLEFAILWVCLFVISIALMHIVAKVSRASTRFFCCEKFSTYRYVQTVQYAHPTRAVNSTNYGTY